MSRDNLGKDCFGGWKNPEHVTFKMPVSHLGGDPKWAISCLSLEFVWIWEIRCSDIIESYRTGEQADSKEQPYTDRSTDDSVLETEGWGWAGGAGLFT